MVRHGVEESPDAPDAEDADRQAEHRERKAVSAHAALIDASPGLLEPRSATAQGSSRRRPTKGRRTPGEWETARTSDWRKLDERRIRDGWAAVIGRRYEMPDGETLEFEIKAEGPTAVVLALTPAQEVVLVREFRPGVEEELLELPGGLIEGDEAPTDAARRELLEETGYA